MTGLRGYVTGFKGLYDRFYEVCVTGFRGL